MVSKELIIIGVPFNGDGTRPEQENPSQSLRESGLIDILQSNERTIADLGDLDIPEFAGKRDVETQILNLEAWLQISKAVANMISAIDNDALTLVLGGDCSILLGIFGGFAMQGRRVGLVMLDAHTDYREPASSETGEPADIELAVMTGQGPQQVTNYFGTFPLINEKEAIIFGYREPDEIENSNISRFDRITMARMGIMEAVVTGLAGFDENLPVWLHLDVDVLDPSIVPVCYPVPNGLSVDEADQFLRICLETRRVIGMSIGCYHPNLDGTGSGAKSILSLLSILSGS